MVKRWQNTTNFDEIISSSFQLHWCCLFTQFQSVPVVVWLHFLHELSDILACLFMCVCVCVLCCSIAGVCVTHFVGHLFLRFSAHSIINLFDHRVTEPNLHTWLPYMHCFCINVRLIYGTCCYALWIALWTSFESNSESYKHLTSVSPVVKSNISHKNIILSCYIVVLVSVHCHRSA